MFTVRCFAVAVLRTGDQIVHLYRFAAQDIDEVRRRLLYPLRPPRGGGIHAQLRQICPDEVLRIVRGIFIIEQYALLTPDRHEVDDALHEHMVVGSAVEDFFRRHGKQKFAFAEECTAAERGKNGQGEDLPHFILRKERRRGGIFRP